MDTLKNHLDAYDVAPLSAQKVDDMAALAMRYPQHTHKETTAHTARPARIWRVFGAFFGGSAVMVCGVLVGFYIATDPLTSSTTSQASTQNVSQYVYSDDAFIDEAVDAILDEHGLWL